MKITISFATRGRASELIFCLSSYIINAEDNSNVEYICMVDYDDTETIQAIEKVNPIAYVYGAEIKYYVSDTIHEYKELERYHNKAGQKFTGDCIFLPGDDTFPITKGWDTDIRIALAPYLSEPVWIGIISLNEYWKGYATMAGINRKRYEITNVVTGTRDTDGFLPRVAQLSGAKHIQLSVDFIHLQRGKKEMNYIKDGKSYTIYGLPNDGKSRMPATYNSAEGEGLQRVQKAANKIKEWMAENGK